VKGKLLGGGEKKLWRGWVGEGCRKWTQGKKKDFGSEKGRLGKSSLDHCLWVIGKPGDEGERGEENLHTRTERESKNEEKVFKKASTLERGGKGPPTRTPQKKPLKVW